MSVHVGGRNVDLADFMSRYNATMKIRSSFIKYFFLALLLVVILYIDYFDLVNNKADEEVPLSADEEGYLVSSVVDGDTLVVLVGDTKETVRVLGIDTPETKYSERGEECYGTEATDEARRLLSGRRVVLTTDDTQADRDSYDRLLRYVTLPDGGDYGEVMIHEGFAEEYTFKGISYQKQKMYQDAENSARAIGLGLWGCE